MPQAEPLIEQMYLKVGGSNVSEEIMDSIVSIEVDDSLLLPDMFSITLRDPSFTWTDSNNFDLGKSVEISVRGENGTIKLLLGEITALEPEFSQTAGPSLVVRGYDQSHRLHRAKRTKTFVQETDSDIVQKIARECGLKSDVDSTREVHEYVCQDNQTDMEFLQQRAQRIGYRMYVEDDKLYFKQAPQSEPDTPELEWGQNLLEFQARLTTAQQVTEVNVRGWDPKNKQEIIGRATVPQDTPQVGESRTGGDAAKRAFNIESKEIITDQPVSTQAEADQLAQSICDEMGNAFIQAEGICQGNSGVHAGTIVELKGVGQRFSGRYRITHAVHRYDDSGYTTRFTISGRRANTLGTLLTSKNGKGSSLVIGIVTNNQDPEEWGRVKVKFPTLPGNEESHWARLISPMAGADRGFEFIPEVNDEVVVAFEQGDFNRPFVLGSLWNGKDKPPEAISSIVNSTGKVDKRIIRSRTGHTITLDDTDGGGKVSIIDQTDKNLIEIDSSQNTVAIKSDDKAEIETKSGHKVILDDSGGKIEVIDKSGNNSVKIDSNQNSISIESAMKLTLKAQTIEIEAQNQMNLKASAQMNVESAMTTVKGSGKLTLQGGMVQIN
jgi:phage protein D/phage baseplate assembly protein gpV